MGIFSGNFQAWKLHSVSDYLNALVYVVLGILFHLIFPGEDAWKKSHCSEIRANIAK